MLAGGSIYAWNGWVENSVSVNIQNAHARPFVPHFMIYDWLGDIETV